MTVAVQWTFARKIATGFALSVLFTLTMGVVAGAALRSVASSKDEVILRGDPLLIQAEQLRGWTERKSSALRAYLLGRNDRFIEQIREARRQFTASLGEIRRLDRSDQGRSAADLLARLELEHQQQGERVMAARRDGATVEAVEKEFEERVLPLREELDRQIQALIARQQGLRSQVREDADQTSSTAMTAVVLMGIAAVLVAGATAVRLGRALGRQIGTAVSQVQSSSAELQSSANEQATGSRMQATAMSEITTTISELLATSRQIAESAQRVAQIAEQTAGAAQSGEGTVDRAHHSIGLIRRHVDLVVNHMLELGKKSQQIGTVLDIVAELAEQTNILAINATIEAAGAGDAGKRFAVVADEIRKLADRVTGSAKEIRGLIDEVRSAVNSTVMATETVSKAVDGGSRQFGEVAGSLGEIARMVGAATQAAREIELSTKQQTTAVEQVNVAVTNVAQGARETEVSSSETLQTASQLAALSRDLLRLVEPEAMARA